MWITGELLAADAATGGSDQLIVMVGGVIVAAIGALATIAVAVVNSRANRTSPSPPPADPTGAMAEIRALRDDFGFLRDRLSKVEQRADDSDERDEMQDRRLDVIERAKDHDHPGWRQYQ